MCRTVVWSAGVRSSDPLAGTAFSRRRRRLQVDERLRVPGTEGVYAVGDASAALWKGRDLPMLSAPAMQEGRYVARSILEDLAGRARTRTPFRYIDKGTMATIGRNSAVAQIGPLRLRGFAGWVVWLTVHIYYLVGFRNRLAVMLSWGWDYMRKSRPIRIIARSEPDRVSESLEGRDAESSGDLSPARF